MPDDQRHINNGPCLEHKQRALISYLLSSAASVGHREQLIVLRRNEKEAEDVVSYTNQFDREAVHYFMKIACC